MPRSINIQQGAASQGSLKKASLFGNSQGSTQEHIMHARDCHAREPQKRENGKAVKKENKHKHS
jgi:hypothetical protein